MKVTYDLSVLFWLFKAKKSNDGLCPIYVRLTINNKRAQLSVGKKIHPANWDAKTGLAMGDVPDLKQFNNYLIKVKGRMLHFYDMLRASYDTITPDMIKNAFLSLPVIPVKKDEATSQKSLLEAFDFVVERFQAKVEKGNRSSETLKKWHSTRIKLVSFMQYQYHKNDLKLDEIKYAFAEDFYDFLAVRAEKPIGEGAAKKYVKNFKQVVKTATEREWVKANTVAGFKCGGDETDIPPLELHEVETIYHKPMPVKRLEEVRDAFIFQCFTGFAYQDVYALSIENIIIFGQARERWLVKKRGKSNVTEMVPILPIVEEILNKYRFHPYCIANNRLLPIDSNARYNGYLKEIAVICHLNRELNTHLARHTFADIMLNLGVPLEVVSRMLGHKTVRTTQRYAKIRKERISINMNLIKKTLFTTDGKLKPINQDIYEEVEKLQLHYN